MPRFMHLRKKPWFIVFEGIDGSGKSTQARLLADKLHQADIPVILTAEPSEGPIGCLIRTLRTRPSPEEERQLFTQDRKDHISRVIAPALKNGISVICDRYVYSSVAYQGARGIDPRQILEENRTFALEPDVTFLLRIGVDEALSRICEGRKEAFTIFEAKANLERVAAIYDALDDSHVKKIDASMSPEEIHREILDYLRLAFTNSSA
ncbi:dTMP kinase [Desulfomonile tiedjei]|uniref:Thymidylate kinase n=1 Tax=Desulfomonile tiedjei (strain ATCC 49306 / DSM 6799 / DCB-1) TaxID=706587 RepID=I4CA29_DESTA|nr:dTMP kinase [Desulfomonile tiedjei]AFM26420.1 thymidylate kinase [Desulfomonile tiedjei DSM 6799]